MTLPQQLEPFTMSDNPMLAVALRHGKLPYVTELGLYLCSLACLICTPSLSAVGCTNSNRHGCNRDSEVEGDKKRMFQLHRKICWLQNFACITLYHCP